MISKFFIWLVNLYRKYISALLPSSCKYRPSCSEYMIDAINEWGFFVGFLMGFFRILRCNPFSKGGYDPVPVNKFKKKRK